ncbi:MAG TPA: hypothetical protein ENH38_02410 [Nitrospirae bacterium]|nr:hypothetical protein [Nitrospirota bacterium]HDO22570.1 hypothetical protein [Nitrospirota bacterium]HDZ87454.1 hypothetical protein [Nitrospirota bacterium]
MISNLKDNEVDSSLWMVPYSTLMLILMILFAVLYGMSYMQSVEYESAISELDTANPGLKKEIILAKAMQKYIEDHNLTGQAEVRVSARFIKMDLKSPALFETGRAKLKPAILPLFEELAKNLQRVDNRVIVEGHTDDVPIHNRHYNSNWELSAARAFNVIYFLIKRNIDPARLIALGFGEYRPAFPNNTEENRAKNRRIDITIIREGKTA